MGILSSFSRLKSGLRKSSESLSSSLKTAIGLNGHKLSEETLEALEEALLSADVGLNASEKLIAQLQRERFEEGTTDDEVKQKLSVILAQTLAPFEKNLFDKIDSQNTPQILLMVGVNGSGKTTTTAKLAELLQQHHKKVRLAAADTFRAGAVQQLKTWAERTNTPITLPENDKTDPAALTYKAVEDFMGHKEDILIVDTAGRLQNRQDLMDELTKIKRTLTKHVTDEQITSILVLDGTVGQNALTQLKAFTQATSLDGLVITKLDSSAKGGIILALAEENAPHFFFVGTGETLEDLHVFNAEQYSKALLGLHS